MEGVGDPGSELGGIGEAANLKKEGVIGQAQVFRSPGGGVIRPNNWRRRVWNKAMGKAGNEDPPTPHSGRRTTASLLSAAGVPQATIQAILGHATMQRTGEYISVSKAEMQAGFAKLAAMSAPSVDTQPKPIST